MNDAGMVIWHTSVLDLPAYLVSATSKHIQILGQSPQFCFPPSALDKHRQRWQLALGSSELRTPSPSSLNPLDQSFISANEELLINLPNEYNSAKLTAISSVCKYFSGARSM